MGGEDQTRVSGPERRTPARPKPAPARPCSTVRLTASGTRRRPAGEATGDGAGSRRTDARGRNQGWSSGWGRKRGEWISRAGGWGYTDRIIHDMLTEIDTLSMSKINKYSVKKYKSV